MKTIRSIDRGGFGVVHEVEDAGERRLARKSFEPQVVGPDREKLRKRFAREVRIQSQLHHPNIMPVVDQDLDADPPWFTMPLASESLADKLARDHKVGSFDTHPWQDILAAVEELHRLGYVHRDLKPQNILYVGEVWVLSDFGLVLPTARETTVLTGTNSAYGSHFYAAPEQAQDFRNTPEAADIFALGCILHDAVVPNPGRIPFAQIREDGSYGPILEKCTEADPRKRFPSIGALRAALYELWRTSEFRGPTGDAEELLSAVRDEPNSETRWRLLIQAAESAQGEERDAILRSIDSELVVGLSEVDQVLYSRLIVLLCEWARGSNFQWEYCDVVGDRLLEAYRVSGVRLQCEVVLATLELAVSHNRWHVMKHVGAMLSPTAAEGLIDRILIESKLEAAVAACLQRIEEVVRWPRDRWHSKLAEFLSSLDEDDD